jgi:hypothetical protein
MTRWNLGVCKRFSAQRWCQTGSILTAAYTLRESQKTFEERDGVHSVPKNMPSYRHSPK